MTSSASQRSNPVRVPEAIALAEKAIQAGPGLMNEPFPNDQTVLGFVRILQNHKTLAILMLMFLTAVPGRAQRGDFQATEIGALRGGSTLPTALNSTGDVVGRSGRLHGSLTSAFLWLNARKTQNLGNLPGGDQSRATGINTSLQVVGAGNGPTSLRAFLWTAADGMRDLGTLPGDTGAKANAINESGEVVGWSSGPAGVRAFLWTRTAGMRQIPGLPDATYTEAFAINNRGQVVGASGDEGHAHAFLWSQADGVRDLGTLSNDESSVAYGINDAGEVVGASRSSVGMRAFIWSKNAPMADIGALAGSMFTEALAINNAGQVVGTSGDGTAVRAFLWTKGAGIQDLNSLVGPNFEVILEEASEINDSGQIVVYGNVIQMMGQDRSALNVHHSSPNRAFLLSPKGPR